ncbi:cupin domain-containing protein [Nitrospinota bacterium]
MAHEMRRVVTGHDENGRGVVLFDDIAANVRRPREGLTSALIWTTENLPAEVAGTEDKGNVEAGTAIRNGTVFRVSKYDPGVLGRVHRTQTIQYGVVISGEIHMELEDTEVHLKAGDVLVQRATVHNWVNRGTVPCVIAFILISADAEEMPEFG